MKRLMMLCCLLLTSLLAGDLKAQSSCPPGYYPSGGGDAGWFACNPIPGNNENAPAAPQPRWQSRWGAIATTSGAYGVASGMASREAAVSMALNQCSLYAKGGNKCAELAVYQDQCIALAWGDTGNVAANGPDLSETERAAMRGCNGKTSNCKIYYSACSYPEQVN